MLKHSKIKWSYWIIIWGLYWIGLSILFGYHNNRIQWELITRFFEIVILIPAVFINIKYLVPQLLYNRKTISYIFASLAIMVVLAFYNVMIWYYAGPFVMDFDISGLTFWSYFQPYYLFLCLSDVFLAWSISIGYSLLITKHKAEQDLVKQKNDFLQIELQLLKAQIHPHFFFNTLNNLYGLSIEGDQKVSDAILKLSGLMDYLLNGSIKQWQPVENELAFIENYVALELLRLKHPDQVLLTINGEVSGKQLPPLLLLPLVENAFKHVDRTDPHYFIDISIKIMDHLLVCTVENNFRPDSSQKKGFGIDNLKKRLKILYKGAAVFDNSIEETNYCSKLIIPLDDTYN